MHHRLTLSMACLLLLIAAAPSNFDGPQPDSSVDRNSEEVVVATEADETETGQPVGPAMTELWIHGMPAAPERSRPFAAKGIRGVINMREMQGTRSRQWLRRYVDLDLAFCITLRWGDVRNKKKDAPPTQEEMDRALEALMQMLTSEESKSLGEKLWIQFYNELAAGNGSVRQPDAAAHFEFATRATERIREEAPWVRIAGPSLVGLRALDEDPSTLRGRRRLRVVLTNEIIEWSAKYADAADVHLHVASGAEARTELEILRRELDRYEGGEATGIVVWEWSSALYEDQLDLEGAKQTVIDIWNALREAHVLHAAYGSYFPNKNLAGKFNWNTLVDWEGRPNEPFHSVIRDIGNGTRTVDDPSDG